MFKKSEWEEFKEIGSREPFFDWDISMGYITFGTCGMSVHKLIKKHWMRKTVNDWRSKDYKTVNAELKNMEWEEM